LPVVQLFDSPGIIGRKYK